MEAHLNLAEVERKVCEIVARYGAVDLSRVSPATQPTAELGIDSLDYVEMFMEIEDTFGVSLPVSSDGDTLIKAVFARKGLRVADLAEVVYLRQNAGRRPERRGWFAKLPPAPPPEGVPFTQLGGVWRGGPLFEPLVAGQSYRRLTEGMRCVLVPAATVEIGSDALPDERPQHAVELRTFLIDAEPVSTTAYCRFLNTIGSVDDTTLTEWFALSADDKRHDHAVIIRTAAVWQPVPGTERLPMVLVSWHGASAYAAWANGRDWREADGQFLPSEAQWEYAARGPVRREFPWGDEPATPDLAVYGRHARGEGYEAATMPMAAVNDRLGMSPFGLHHMAGNVWHWCRDWYAADFYGTQPAGYPDAVNVTPTGIRSERGGSWVGPAELCRSSYRRGRPPHCRGRCLGFRCVSDLRTV